MKGTLDMMIAIEYFRIFNLYCTSKSWLHARSITWR